MSTLFVYCSDDDTLNALCNESALRKHNTVALELRKRKRKSSLGRYFDAYRTQDFHLSGVYNIEVDAFDKIIFACDEYLGELPPEICAFIGEHELRYKDIDCIVFGDGRTARKAKDNLRVKVSLSGGTVRNTVCVSAKELKREAEDVLFSVRHRLAV